MILNYLLVELFDFMNFFHKTLNSILVVEIPLALILFELCFLVSQLHLHSFMLGSLLLNLVVQLIVSRLNVADLIIRKVNRS